MFNNVLSWHPLYEAGSIISLVALLMRNQITLRLVLLLAYFFQISNNVIGGSTINLESAAWNVLNCSINIYVLAELIYGRTTLWFSAADRDLFDCIGQLTPGEFRKFMKFSTRQHAEVETLMTIEGRIPEKIFFVYEGEITITKSGRETRLLPQAFVGEIAFLKRDVASASVQVSPQSRWIEWSASTLRRQIDRDRELRTVIMRLIGEDLAQKVARA